MSRVGAPPNPGVCAFGLGVGWDAEGHWPAGVGEWPFEPVGPPLSFHEGDHVGRRVLWASLVLRQTLRKSLRIFLFVAF